MEKRGFYFNTDNNSYYYDDIKGSVYCLENNSSEDIIYDNKIYEKKIIDTKKVEENIKNMDSTQLTLIVTEECNLRCKYCIFSGNYDNSRTHCSNFMDFSIAKEAITKYLNKSKTSRKRNLIFVPKLGFYGGEPLLNFTLIKKSVEYAESIYNGKINYTITTNATLLNDDMIDFFVSKNFLFVVSLNGDKNENDRLRVYRDGKGTFDDIFLKLNQINQKYPDFYKNNVKFSVTYDNGTDMFALKDFFENNELVKGKLAVLSKVSNLHTNWYDQYLDEQNSIYNDQIKTLKEEFLRKLKTNEPIDLFSKKLFSIHYFLTLNRFINLDLKKVKPPIQPFSGSCIPTNKISVDYKGLLHMCEKVNATIPYGDVYKWIDYKKISNIINRYNNFLGETCINCPIQRLCKLCYNDLINSEGNFELDTQKICPMLIKQEIKNLTDIYSILESGITTIELKNNLI